MHGLRPYSTIGIEGFLSGPPVHPLSPSYLSGIGDDVDGDAAGAPMFFSSSSSSWEMTGTIKQTPQDFVVREVLPDFVIVPGLSAEDRGRVRVAALRPAGDGGVVPRQAEVPKEDERGTDPATGTSAGRPNGSSPAPPAHDDATDVVVPPATVVQNYLDRAGTDDHPSEKLMQALVQLQERAEGRIRRLAAAGGGTTCNHQHERNAATVDTEASSSPSASVADDADGADVVWIPPPAASFGPEETTTSLRIGRGAFHRAVRVEYPFLKTEGGGCVRPQPSSGSPHDDGTEIKIATADDAAAIPTEHWIRVTIERCFDDLVGYLHDPPDDLRRLLLFRNRGFEGARHQDGGATTARQILSATGVGHHRDGRMMTSDLTGDGTTSSCAILRLRKGLSKDDRRVVHQLIAAKNKHFATSSTQIVVPPCEAPSNEGGGDTGGASCVTGLVVTWQRNSMARGHDKKKRKRRPTDGDSRSADAAAASRNNYTTNHNVTNSNDNLLCVLQKDRKEHLTAIQRLTQTLRCRQSDIGFAGIKDMHAVTYQFITLRNMRRHRAERANEQLRNQGIRLGLFYNVDFVLNTGDLEGNQFEIVIRDIKRVAVHRESEGSPLTESFSDCDRAHVAHMVRRIQQHGFINFYGEQRTGAPGSDEEVGVRAFDVGQAMLQRNYGRAIELLMKGTRHRETEQVRHVRQVWKESGGDPAATLKAFQGADILAREKAVLRGLNRYTDNPLEAIRCLSHNMRMFYINAYQSYVWNQAASQRIRLYGDKVVKGDLYFANGIADRGDVMVVADESAVDISQVVLPLPGYSVVYPENKIGEFYKELLRTDGVTFAKDAVPESTAKGTYRKLVVRPTQLTYDVSVVDVNSRPSTNLTLTFQLPKGCYATMLLRELMLTTVTRSGSPSDQQENG